MNEPAPNPSAGCSPREWKQLGILVGVYAAVFIVAALRQYHVFGRDSGDFALFQQMFWWTMNGKPFYSSAWGHTNFGVHAAFLWVQLVPIYWLAQSWKTLVVLQTLFLAATAVPVYLIGRQVFHQHSIALILATTYLFLPPIVSQNLNQVEEPSFLIAYLLLAFYFHQRERFGWFMFFAVLASLGRENVPLAVIMMGVYSLIQRRSKKWILAPILFGAVYFWLALYVLIPYFRQGHQWHAMRMFTYLGDTPGSIVLNALTNPGLVIRHLLQGEVITYTLLLVQPVGWVLPFLSPVCLMALPDLAMNLITENNAMRVIPWHYNVLTGSFLFLGALFSIRRIGQRLRARYGGNPELILAVALLALTLAHWFIWLAPAHFRKLPHHESLQRALAAVPPDKSVLAPLRMQVHVAAREHYNNLGIFKQKPEYAAQFEYVILDANERQYQPFITPEFFNQLHRNPNYRLIFAENNVFVFQRLGGESDWRVPPPT